MHICLCAECDELRIFSMFHFITAVFVPLQYAYYTYVGTLFSQATAEAPSGVQSAREQVEDIRKSHFHPQPGHLLGLPALPHSVRPSPPSPGSLVL